MSRRYLALAYCNQTAHAHRYGLHSRPGSLAAGCLGCSRKRIAKISIDSVKPRTGYQVSFPLFGENLSPAARRFAVAETLSHLERLVADGRASRHEDSETVSYTAA